MLKNMSEITDGISVMTIATSGDQITEDELKQLGVQTHFVKPIDVKAFRTEVDELLAGREIPQDEQEEQQEEMDEHTDQESDDQEEKV